MSYALFPCEISKILELFNYFWPIYLICMFSRNSSIFEIFNSTWRLVGVYGVFIKLCKGFPSDVMGLLSSDWLRELGGSRILVCLQNGAVEGSSLTLRLKFLFILF